MKKDTNCIRTAIDPSAPMQSMHTGVFEETLEINGKQRRMITYIPKQVRSSTAGILVLPDNGTTAQELLDNSNWCKLSETDEHPEKFIVFFLEADGEWSLGEPYGESGGDVAYVQVVYQEAARRNKFCVHESKFYLVGYGAGGTMAQMAAAAFPALYAGVAAVDAKDLSANYLDACGDALCTELDGFSDPEARKGIRNRDLAVPAWLISNDSTEQTADTNAGRYWRQCAAADKQRQRRMDTVEYVRTTPPPYGINQEREAFRVWFSSIENAAEEYGEQVNRRIWSEFLYGVRRWMSGPGGDLRRTYDPVRDLGMEYHYQEVGGWMREWYVYVPDMVRRNPERPVPLVFAMHGYTCSAEIFIGNSEWFKVARDYGFIVVFPSAVNGLLKTESDNQAAKAENTALPAWNIGLEADRPNELDFFTFMLEDVCECWPIDRSRVFATGHSMGSMMTQLLGMAHPELFAAIAPCSGVILPQMGVDLLGLEAVKSRRQDELPIWMFSGENEGWLLPHLPESGNVTGNSICTWWKFNRMSGKPPEDFTSGWQVQDRWNDLVYKKEDVPMIRYTWVEYMPHATMTEMSYRIWEEFFSHLSRVDGSIKFAH